MVTPVRPAPRVTGCGAPGPTRRSSGLRCTEPRQRVGAGAPPGSYAPGQLLPSSCSNSSSRSSSQTRQTPFFCSNHKYIAVCSGALPETLLPDDGAYGSGYTGITAPMKSHMQPHAAPGSRVHRNHCTHTGITRTRTPHLTRPVTMPLTPSVPCALKRAILEPPGLNPKYTYSIGPCDAKPGTNSSHTL
jgi:hypothetical protein